MFLVKIPILLALVLGLSVASTGFAEVYKWIDDEGNVHFGDCPPASCESETLQIEPPPSDHAVKEAQDRFKRLKDYRKKLQESRKEETKRAEKPEVRIPPDVECFTLLTDAWGGKIPDTREAVQRRPLSGTELRQIKRLFHALKGRWRGNLEDTSCIRPDATPPTKTYYYEFRLRAHWKADQPLEIEADLEGVEAKADLRRQFFWILLSNDGLRFRKAAIDILPELDRPRYDVEILAIGDNSIRFYLRRGGALRRTNVFSFHKVGRGFIISEFFYVQGALAGKRQWTIER
ncbi:MAG: DUF4124 domain-containing protein [Candidatus Thiodiazotropha sp. (ex Monitilora ramsayi)]|nr:DUF4124 domain-containing protein [Candidatus Thiodiazotropha sp. (ex Monitilora ramsayi)]